METKGAEFILLFYKNKSEVEFSYRGKTIIIIPKTNSLPCKADSLPIPEMMKDFGNLTITGS